MEYFKPTAIVVTASYKFDEKDHWIDIAWRMAKKVYSKYKLSHLISLPIYAEVNNIASFLCAWDGSKEGWNTSDMGDKAQKEFVEWLRSVRYDDGSSPLTWAQIVYGDKQDPVVQFLAHKMASDKLRWTEPLSNIVLLRAVVASEASDAVKEKVFQDQYCLIEAEHGREVADTLHWDKGDGPKAIRERIKS